MGEVTKAMRFEAEVEEGREEATWDKLLLRAPVRVLLVEQDDCTRQIITALLRKCGYRVAVASDGLKAWEMLREKDHNIDLVLTEVELPKMSGLVLLTMMMDQDSCNSIPVIMMSSNDSISISFKCMINGAADFLVKPIRKNELKNLWQHVWRKQKGQNGAIQSKTVDLSIENATDQQDDIDCCEKDSDAQSSCTRSDVEVESTCKLRNNIELNQARQKKNLCFDETSPDSHFKKKSDGIGDGMPLFPCDEENGVISLGSDIEREGKTECQELDRDESSTELFNLIEVINNRPQHISISEKSPDNIELEKKQSSMPSLELSLDGYPHIIPNRQGNDGPNTLHHSNSSAFSLYNHNSTVSPKVSKLSNLHAQNKESSNSSIEPSPYKPSVTPLLHDGLIPEPDGTKLMDSSLSNQEGTTLRCTPIRLIPFPVPVGDMSFDSTGSNPFLQPVFYRQSTPYIWGALTSLSQEAFTENHPCQSGFNDFKSAQGHNQEDYSLKCHDFQAHERQEEEDELVDERRHAFTVTGDSASVCNDNRYNLNENGSTVVSNEENRHVSTLNISEAGAPFGNEDGFQTFKEIKSADKCHLSQREAALTKFRLKRKERCFEKKVRYLSRKKLAEQRPRVKGQFVRQV